MSSGFWYFANKKGKVDVSGGGKDIGIVKMQNVNGNWLVMRKSWK